MARLRTANNSKFMFKAVIDKSHEESALQTSDRATLQALDRSQSWCTQEQQASRTALKIPATSLSAPLQAALQQDAVLHTAFQAPGPITEKDHSLKSTKLHRAEKT